MKYACIIGKDMKLDQWRRKIYIVDVYKEQQLSW